jgi:hypothetical protein
VPALDAPRERFVAERIVAERFVAAGLAARSRSGRGRSLGMPPTDKGHHLRAAGHAMSRVEFSLIYRRCHWGRES